MFDLNDIPLEIDDWMEGKELAEGTRKTYFYDIRMFCEFLGKTPRVIIDEYLDESLSGTHMIRRNIFRDIPRYKNFLKKKDYADKTYMKKLISVKSFLDYHYIPQYIYHYQYLLYLPHKSQPPFCL